MKKMFLTLVMAAMVVSVSFGACDVACREVCTKISNKQQRTECFADCGYDEKGLCIETRQIGKGKTETSGFANDNTPAAR